MKKFFLFVLSFTLAIIPFLAKNVYAQSQESVNLPADEYYQGDYYAFGEFVTISGTVDGDVYAAGQRIVIDGLVTGDVLVAAENVNITGTVEQDARIAGFDVIVSGDVARNLTIAAFNIELLQNAFVGRNAQLVGDTLSINGDIRGDTVKYSSEDWSKNTRKDSQSTASGFNFFTKILSLTSTLVLGFILIKLFPNYTDRATGFVLNKFGKSLLVGFLGLILFPLIILILLITILGIPLSLLTASFFVIYLFLTRIYVMQALGTKINQIAKLNIKKRGWIFVLGLLIYYSLSAIPLVGGIIKILVITAGFGAALMNERELYKLAKRAKIF